MKLEGFNFYDIVGILIPGAVFLLFISFVDQRIGILLNGGDMTVGGVTLFIILAYAVGHAVAAAGNALEKVLWLPIGKPTGWLRYDPPRLLAEFQVRRIESQFASRHTELTEQIPALSASDWEAVYAEIYRDVIEEHPGRTLVLNSLYGMSRGLAVSLLSMAVIAMWTPALDHVHVIVFTIVGILFLIRARRFGRYLAKEVFVNFLLLPPTRSREDVTNDDSKSSITA